MIMPRRFRAAVLAVAAAAGALGGIPANAWAQGENCAGPKSDTWINVTVEGVRNSRGLMAVTLYADDSRKFLAKRGSLYVGRVDATAPVTRMCLYVPKPGTYALAVYHDEDASTRINRAGLLGMPTEGFGFSNNPPTIASLPSFRSVRIAIPRSNLSTTIQLKYP